jgi:hypothetical protein
MSGTVITQPVMLYAPLLLPGANKRRRRRFPRFVHAVCLNQKKLAISEPKKGFAALGIGASAEHIFTASCPAKNDLGEPLDSELLARCMPRGCRGARLESRVSGTRCDRSLSSVLPTNRQQGRYSVADSLSMLCLDGYHQSYAQGSALSAELFRCRRSEKPLDVESIAGGPCKSTQPVGKSP